VGTGVACIGFMARARAVTSRGDVVRPAALALPAVCAGRVRQRQTARQRAERWQMGSAFPGTEELVELRLREPSRLRVPVCNRTRPPSVLRALQLRATAELIGSTNASSTLTPRLGFKSERRNVSRRSIPGTVKDHRKCRFRRLYAAPTVHCER